MDVLLIGADNPAGEALQRQVAALNRHRIYPLSASASRWKRERHAKKAARKDHAQAVVDLRLAWQVSAGETPDDADLERTHWLAKACEHSSMCYVFLSSDRVFSGDTHRSLREDDPVDACGTPGFEVIEAEARIKHAAPSALLLRTGPLVAATGDNLLTRVLQRMFTEPESAFDHSAFFCPVAVQDLARVLSAVLDQVSVGARSTGVFHYCSADRTTEYELAEFALASAGQYRDCGTVSIRALEKPEKEQRLLDCSRLRDGFAIKQMPWRKTIPGLIREYCSRAGPEAQVAGA